MRIVLLGAPGSGKVTQAMKLSEYFGISWITTSHMLHEAADEGTLPGRQAKAYLDLGQHVPDEIVCAVLKERLTRPDIHNGFLLVGFPRTATQATALDEMLETLNLPLDLVLLLEGDPDHFMERLEGRSFCQTCGTMYNIFSNPPKVEGMCNLCGGPVRRRSEDNEETIAHRIRSYEQQAEALIQYYTLHGKLRQVSAVEDSGTVYDALCHIVQEQPPTVIDTEPVIAAPVPIAKKPASDNAKDSEQAVSLENTANEKKTNRVKQKTKRAKTGKTTRKKAGVKNTSVSKKGAIADKKAPIKKKSAKKTVSKKPKATKKTVGRKKAETGKKGATKKKTAKKPMVKKAAAQTKRKKAATAKKKVAATGKKKGSTKKASTTKRASGKGGKKK